MSLTFAYKRYHSDLPRSLELKVKRLSLEILAVRTSDSEDFHQTLFRVILATRGTFLKPKLWFNSLLDPIEFNLTIN